MLETRLAPATITVTSIADTIANDSQVTLREAITAANQNANFSDVVAVGAYGNDTIQFNIPGTGLHTIKPGSALPGITEAVTIDGYTQPGSSANTNSLALGATALGTNAVLTIELDGELMTTGTVNGLFFNAVQSGNSLVRGLVINRFTGSGIATYATHRLQITGNFIGTDATGTVGHGNGLDGVEFQNGDGNLNVVGGSTPAARNLISGNQRDGVGLGSDSNIVDGNFIGTDATGTMSLGNGRYGVTTAGGTTGGHRIGNANAGNLISGNDIGINVRASDVHNVGIYANFIGTNLRGDAALPNRLGIDLSVGSRDSTVGYPGDAYRNVISGNTQVGIQCIAEFFGGGNIRIWNNYIGRTAEGTTAADGTIALPNGSHGVWFNRARGTNYVGGTGAGEGNVIAFNAGDGVFFNQSDILVQGNSFFQNSGLGIDRSPDGVTANTTGGSFNFPVITGVTATSVIGTLNSTANTGFRLEFFASDTPDPTNFGEGRRYLGFVDVTTDSGGNVSFTATVSPITLGEYVTATSTRSNGTSEFSQRRKYDPILPDLPEDTADSANIGVLVSDLTVSSSITVSSVNNNSIGTWQYSIDSGGSWPALGPSTTLNNNATTRVRFLPGVNKFGSTSFSFGSSTATLTVTPVADTPTVPTSVTTNEDVLSAPIVLTRNVVDGAEVTYFYISGVANGTVYLNDGVTAIADGSFISVAQGNAGIRYKPKANYYGTGYFSVRASVGASSSGLGGDAVQVVVTINPVNDGTHFVVNSTDDTIADDNVITLREAITAAITNMPCGNALAGSAGMDTIEFAIGSGVHTITLSSALPTITEPVTIDGYTQPGSSVNTNSLALGAGAQGDNAILCIVLNGASAGAGVNGLTFGNAADGSFVRGLVINGFSGSGIYLDTCNNVVVEGNFIGTDVSGSLDLGNARHGIEAVNDGFNNVIGGTTPESRNVISGNIQDGIALKYYFAAVVRGNFIGTDASGTLALENGGRGVSISSDSSIPTTAITVGTTSSSGGNLISGNDIGVFIGGASTGDNYVYGNFIGTDLTGTQPIGNRVGVQLGATTTQDRIGYPGSGVPNVISGNREQGILFTTTPGQGNLIRANYIGTQADGINPLGNGRDGIYAGDVFFQLGGTLPGEGNIIAYNGGAGVVLTTREASIQGNSFFQNAGLGIDRADNGVTPYNATDALNLPVLTSVTGTTVAGRLTTSASSTSFRIEFYATPPDQADPSGYGEGKVFLGYTSVTSPLGGGFVDFSFTPAGGVPAGWWITATATSSSGTSEFAASRRNTVVNVAPVLATGGILTLAPVAEDTALNVGTRVADVIASAPGIDLITDPDPLALEGIAVTAVDNTHGAWQFSLDGGSNWQALSTPPVNQALLLAADAGTRVRFLPSTDFWGLVSNGLTFLAWDQTTDINGQLADITNTGGTTAFSSSARAASICVRPTADTPSVTDATTNEATQTTSGLVLSPNLVDVNTVTHFQITGITNGTLYQADGTTLIQNGQFITVAQGSAGLRFTPALPSDGSFLVRASTSSSVEGLSTSLVKATILVNPVASPFVVTNTLNNSNPGSLRWAIEQANSRPGLDTITFNILASGVQHITTGSDFPFITDSVKIDGYTQPGAQKNTLAVGSDAVLLIEIDAGGGPGKDGLVFQAGGNIIQGLIVTGAERAFNGTGGIGMRFGYETISPDNDISSNNTIRGNYIIGNVTGIAVYGNNNLVGGPGPGDRNVISGQRDNLNLMSSGNAGIDIGGDANRIENNYIGTNVAGTSAIAGNSWGVKLHALPIRDAVGGNLIGWAFPDNNVIGGQTPETRNVISGNGNAGVYVTNEPTTATGAGNRIQGNYIGTNATGTGPIANAQGVAIGPNARNVLVGGTELGSRNLISGNSGVGVYSESDAGSMPATGTRIEGNWIGTNATGTAALANGQHGVSAGYRVTIGGTARDAGNVISGNIGAGISLGIYGERNVVQGNTIGLGADGITVVPNAQGIGIGSDNNTIEDNLISGNIGGGVAIAQLGDDASNNVVQGNYIGTDFTGTLARGNGAHGVRFDLPNGLVGGTLPGQGNVIAFNGGQGVAIGSGVVQILGNSIFANGGLGIDLPGLGQVSANDAGDVFLPQNFPVLTSAHSSGDTIEITGTLNSTVDTYFRLEFFSNPADAIELSGYGEGRQHLGYLIVHTPVGSNDVSFTFFVVGPTVPEGSRVTANATSLDNFGNPVVTSEFAHAIPVQALTKVVSITRADPDPTNADPVHFTVIFGDPVTGVDVQDFALTASGSITGAAVTDVVGSGTTYTVTVNTGSFDGTLRLDLIDNDSIQDAAGHRLGGTGTGSGVGNGDFTTGQVYSVDKTPPRVQSISGPGGMITTPVVTFTVTFTETVTGVDLTDFVLSTSGLYGTAITNVAGSGTTYTITITTGAGAGNIGLDVIDNDSIQDAAYNKLGGTGVNNGDFAGPTSPANRPLILSPTVLPQSTVGMYYSQTITATNGVGTISFSVTGLPATLQYTVAGNQLTISGTPTAAGTYSFTVTASIVGASGLAPTSRSYSVIINPTVTATASTLSGGTVGSPYSQTIATGGTGSYTSLMITAGALPGGLSLQAGVDPSTGQARLMLTGPPTASGAFSFKVKITDAVGVMVELTYTISIAPKPPVKPKR